MVPAQQLTRMPTTSWHTPGGSRAVVRGLRRVTPDFLTPSRRAAASWPVAAEEIAMLLQAGTPLVDAIQTVGVQCKPHLRHVLLQVRDKVLAGQDLSVAMQAHHKTFDKLSIRLVAIGEAGGCLGETLHELASYKSRVASFANRTLTLLIYPLFVAAVGSAAAIFLMTEVMPALLASLEETGRELPAATRVVKQLSALLRDHFVLLAAATGLGGTALVALLRRPAVTRWRHRCWLKLPILGPIAMQQNLSRLSLMTSVLLRNGVPLNESLRLAAETSTNSEVARTTTAIAADIEKGDSLVVAINKDDLFPPLVKRVFVVGEETGDLAGLLARLAADLNQLVERRSARVAALMEPALIVGMAVFVGFLLFAVMQPILESANVLDL
jgi:general secretion pathway protein F